MRSRLVLEQNKYTKKATSNGLFPPMETETEMDPCTESFPDHYIVLCRTFSTGMEMATEMVTVCILGIDLHPRDRSLSQFYYILIRGMESISIPVGKPA